MLDISMVKFPHHGFSPTNANSLLPTYAVCSLSTGTSASFPTDELVERLL
jgi:hypothetical protein